MVLPFFTKTCKPVPDRTSSDSTRNTVPLETFPPDSLTASDTPVTCASTCSREPRTRFAPPVICIPAPFTSPDTSSFNPTPLSIPSMSMFNKFPASVCGADNRTSAWIDDRVFPYDISTAASMELFRTPCATTFSAVPVLVFNDTPLRTTNAPKTSLVDPSEPRMDDPFTVSEPSTVVESNVPVVVIMSKLPVVINVPFTAGK